MDIERMFEMGFEAGMDELEKIASDDGVEKEAFSLRAWRKARKARSALSDKLAKKLKKKGGRVAFKHLSAGRKVVGLGAIAAAAAGGARFAKKKR